MGAVYLGRRAGGPNDELVAVKLSHPHLLDSEASTVLEDEARLVAHIDDPHVVPLLSIERTEDGPLLVMPYVLGVTVAEIARAIAMAGIRVPVSIAARIALDALAGLAAVHEARGEDRTLLHIVHRDISPQNLIVGVDGRTRILDFGVAKAVGRLQKTTRDGSLKGKVAYMAPEQIHGAPIGPYTDVYALGVLLWELVAGARLFAGENEGETLRRALVSIVPSLREKRDDVPAAFDEVVARALARETRSRFTSARAMADALGLAVAPASRDEVVHWLRETCGEVLHERETFLEIARRPAPRSALPSETSPLPLPPPPPRRRRSALAVLMVALVVTVGAGVALRRVQRSPPHEEAVVETSAAAIASAPPALPAAIPPSAPAARSSTGTSAPLRRPATTTPRPSALPRDCVVPYTVDENGRKKFRAECLQ
jgi:serine/threonine-protein kinase